MRKSALLMGALSLVLAAGSTLTGVPAAADDAQQYVVLYRSGANLAAARQAVREASGTIVRENPAIGVATVKSSNPRFVTDTSRKAALEGVARSVPIGTAPRPLRPKPDDVERMEAERREAAERGTPAESGTPAGEAAVPHGPEPLSRLQWNMAMIRATEAGSYHVERGDKRVLVGIMDTGIDGSHPDIAPNFNRSLSRNFTRDIPSVDGPCAEEPDKSCADPSSVDENGHGTHVAGIVAAPINGLGIAGVAPNVSLVNIRAGQDSGYFFIQPTVDALTYAGDRGIDVVNMSFFIDPWLFNCAANPADSPAEQRQQRIIVAATQRALDYAHRRGVTLVAALGNEHMDMGNPQPDTISPDFPPGNEKPRTIDNATCLTMPSEGRNVISVSALGHSRTKADYSNYGLEQTDVSAPGGYFRDFVGTPHNRVPENTILSAYPRRVARLVGDIDKDGVPTTPFVVRDCRAGVCAYYQYLQGTSMAAPHAAGVAALIVSRWGSPAPNGGLTMPPPDTERFLKETAWKQPCPEPRLVSYANVDRPPEYNARCEGTLFFNGFYGYGIVDALAAVTLHPRQ